MRPFSTDPQPTTSAKGSRWWLLRHAAVGLLSCACALLPVSTLAVPMDRASGVEETDTSGTSLVMIESAGCPFCILWHKQIGPIYPLTPFTKRAPLRRIDLAQLRASGLTLAAPVRYTPTFVLMEDQREVGRITGYTNDEMFWGLLEVIFERLRPDSL